MIDCPECEDGLMIYLEPQYETLSGRETVIQHHAIWQCFVCFHTVGEFDL